jgi:acetyl-CoA carboxylase biotin carboxyl carrier protein
VARRKKASSRAAAKAVKPRARKADNPPDDVLGGIGLTDLRRLIRLVQKTGIGELEINAAGKAVRISAHAGVSVVPAGGVPVAPVSPHGATPSAPAGDGQESPTPTAPATDRHVAITSPMVGTFYRAPAPDADPYVENGDSVDMGQTVCIIEAMKLMNEIESDVRGRVVQILVENAQPVEFGQKLFLIEPV